MPTVGSQCIKYFHLTTLSTGSQALELLHFYIIKMKCAGPLSMTEKAVQWYFELIWILNPKIFLIQDYELQLIAYKALIEPLASPLKKTKMESISDNIIQEVSVMFHWNQRLNRYLLGFNTCYDDTRYLDTCDVLQSLINAFILSMLHCGLAIVSLWLWPASTSSSLLAHSATWRMRR